jgi:hypothetical protein
VVPDKHFQFGGGLQQTLLHPIVLVAMVVSAILILFLPRKYVIVPVLFTSLVVPLAQQIVVGGLHLFVMRIIILVGCGRMLISMVSSQEELLAGGFNAVDKWFTLWAIFRTLATLILYASMPAVIGEGAFLWDVFGGYFLFRFLIRDIEDITRSAKVLALVAILAAAGMFYEKIHFQNVFGFLGGVPIVPTIRMGTIRAQGPFMHAILAGTFGATAAPLFFWLWKVAKSKFLAVIGFISSTVIVVAAASSTALMALGAGIFALCFWPFRKMMRKVRWGIVILIIALHLVMKAPVWFVIAHVDIVGGNSSYQRAFLIDQFIRHFGDWWLLGSFQSDSWGFDMWDHTNQFVAEGESGGLATLICFIAMISVSFGMIGKARKAVDGDNEKEWILWILGAALFAHVVGYFGISYFDQTRVAWFALLAMISAATAPILASQTAKEAVPRVGLLAPRFANRAALAHPAAEGVPSFRWDSKRSERLN